MLAKSWDAIMQSKDSGIRSLELRGTMSKEISSWSSQDFKDFLERWKNLNFLSGRMIMVLVG